MVEMSFINGRLKDFEMSNDKRLKECFIKIEKKMNINFE
jgi:hypothetical protein